MAASSKNKNIFVSVSSEIAEIGTDAISRLLVMTIRVLSAGHVIMGAFSGSIILFKLHFSIYGGGVLRLIPAR